jgi:hypothetical protein
MPRAGQRSRGERSGRFAERPRAADDVLTGKLTEHFLGSLLTQQHRARLTRFRSVPATAVRAPVHLHSCTQTRQSRVLQCGHRRLARLCSIDLR